MGFCDCGKTPSGSINNRRDLLHTVTEKNTIENLGILRCYTVSTGKQLLPS